MRALMIGAAVLLSLGQAEAKTSYEKQAVIEWVKQNLRDPYSIRGAKITAPVSFGDDAVLVCVEMNAKNAYGGYIGAERHPFVFKAGRVVGPNQYYSARVNVTTSTCEGALPLNWRPFPELERL
jgi:hypothetical protein